MIEKKLQDRKHVILVFLFSGLLSLVLISITIMIPYKNTNNYMFAFSDKIDLIKSHTNSPRLILLGGSNLAFGIDSQLLENVYKIPVVNMGLHTGLGLKFILDSTKPFLKKGDILVLSFEYNFPYERNMYGSETLLFLLQHVYPEGIKFLNIQQCLALLQMLPKYLLSMSEAKTEYLLSKIINNNWNIESTDKLRSCYDRRAFNVQGDVIFHWSDRRQNYIIKPYGAYKRAINFDSFLCIDKFKAEVNDKGVRVFWLYPPFQESTYRNQFKNIKELENLLKGRAINSDILNTPEDAVLPDNFFYDTVYHCNKEGTQRRMKKFIHSLSGALSKSF